jgi:small subunit ribosomal protein S4
MGDVRKKKKLYSRPKKPFDKPRIESENKIVQNYGLKNKKEIWKTDAVISTIRRRAKELINGTDEERNEFFERLNKIGLNVKETSDVLALTKENLLERRLQTLVFKKGFANTAKQARQFIVHKLIAVDGAIVNTPSTIIPVERENGIKIVKEIKIKSEGAKK